MHDHHGNGIGLSGAGIGPESGEPCIFVTVFPRPHFGGSCFSGEFDLAVPRLFGSSAGSVDRTVHSLPDQFQSVRTRREFPVGFRSRCLDDGGIGGAK